MSRIWKTLTQPFRKRSNPVKRIVTSLIVHCSASPSQITMEDIRQWHKEKGWSDIGYHYVIEAGGVVRYGRHIEAAGAHCLNHNKHSVGICLVGGTDGAGVYHPFSQDQLDSLNDLIDCLIDTLPQPLTIYPHNYFANKLCPDIILSEVLEPRFLSQLKERKAANEEIERSH